MRRARGFTLVEMLVALFAMAVLAMLSWRGLDGMVRAQQQTQARADEVLALQTGLAQWRADLDALVQLPQQTALEWNGRVLRLTRQSGNSPSDGLLVVAWGRRVVDGSSRWLRWQSQPLTTRSALDAAWQQADLWSQNPGDVERRNEVAITSLDDWQIFFFRGGNWTNPQSNASTTGGTLGGRLTQGRGVIPLPDGVRLVLTLPAGHAIAGELRHDWSRL